jgi:hypothetical protein
MTFWSAASCDLFVTQGRNFVSLTRAETEPCRYVLKIGSTAPISLCLSHTGGRLRRWRACLFRSINQHINRLDYGVLRLAPAEALSVALDCRFISRFGKLTVLYTALLVALDSTKVLWVQCYNDSIYNVALPKVQSTFESILFSYLENRYEGTFVRRYILHRAACTRVHVRVVWVKQRTEVRK